MGETKIEWADFTFNPWEGCTKISPGCDNCYAEARDKRFTGGALWGAKAPRRRTSPANWRKPLAWDRAAKKAGKRARVFCASLADIFDNHASILPEWRDDLWQLILNTQHLDWLLLTKRPQNIERMLPHGWGEGWNGVWLGTTVENQTEADRRIPHLLATPAAVRFLSCEPLLGPIAPDLTGVDWVIVGGESGPGARPMHPDWARSLRDQCKGGGVPFFFKQWGDWMVHKIRPGQDLGGDLRADRVRHVCRDRENDGHFREGDRHMERVGKARAGRLLDGVEHNEMPASAGG